MKPMLAFKMKPSKVSFPLFMQPKFNGIRSLYLPEHSTCQSRDQHLWLPEVIPCQLTQLTRLGFRTDGEFYSHGMSLQQINSRVAINRQAPHNDIAAISYYLFDIPSVQPMWKRVKQMEQLRKQLDGVPNLVISPVSYVNSEREADYWHARWKAEGFEGSMYRQYDAPYGFEHNCGNQDNRWWFLQKRKDFLDMEVTIEGVYEGENGFVGMLGGFHCRMDDGTPCDIGGGLDLDQRQCYWADPDRVLGARMRVNYEMLSDGGQPLKATIEAVYELY